MSHCNLKTHCKNTVKQIARSKREAIIKLKVIFYIFPKAGNLGKVHDQSVTGSASTGKERNKRQREKGGGAKIRSSKHT